jgi:hypothetical protein
MLLAGLTTGRRGAGLESIEQTIGLEPVREIAPRIAASASASGAA